MVDRWLPSFGAALLTVSGAACSASPSAKACVPGAVPSFTADGAGSAPAHVIEALTKAGHQCVDKTRAVVCDEAAKDRFTLFVVYAPHPDRLVVIVPSKMKVACDDAAPRFNKLNRQFETVTLTCEGDDFTAAGTLMITNSGVTGSDFATYVQQWEDNLATIFRANRLAEVVN